MKKIQDSLHPFEFRHFRRGRALDYLRSDELQYLQPWDQDHGKHRRALLLIHGFASSPAVFRFMLPNIQGYDRICCPVLPGHGASIAAFSQTTAQNWLESVSETCQTLLQDYEQVDVLGLSLGGLLACHLGQTLPIHHLYLLAPALKLRLSEESSLKLTNFLYSLGFRTLRNTAGNIANPQSSEIAYTQVPLSAIREILQFIQSFQWKPIQCPVDLFLGKQDEVVDSETVEQLFQDCEQVSIHWLENSAHVLPVDSDYRAILETINLSAQNPSSK